ncbi:uncharacterized protein LOC132066749 [Lycium ferocissimum]|uniref:uncharacterized protein LOC132066749 n=1 Tax=Lycium ferocissimum TaxID=112874 RepID=UPI00281597AC|nr:uncharacterized protein LOC132066749 [Lycium ferocissimum]
MKRQRGSKMIGNNYEEKKKAKRVVEKQCEEVKKEEEQRENNGGGNVVKEVELMADQCDNNNWINEWLCSWNMGDEQMSWGTCWSPVWDMEFMGEAYKNLYNDVLWDDDIWDLKAIKEVPSS